MSADARERIATLIRALKAKTVANGCTEAEALAAAEKLAQLLDEHDMTVDEAELRASPFDQCSQAHGDDVGPRLWKPAAAIGKLTGARYWISAPGVEPVEHTFFGFAHETAVAHYLLDVCARAMRGERDRLEASLALLRPAYRRARIWPFLDGMADRLAERILALRPARPAGRGLVAVRGELIDKALAERGVTLAPTHLRSSRTGDDAYRLGRVAADDVALNPGVAGAGGSSARLRSARP